ncbi:MAG: hypothetical protein ACOY3X_13875 [Pseudomonadota bacterium]
MDLIPFCRRLLRTALLLTSLLAAVPALAGLHGLDDGELAGVSGTGIAIGLDDFQFAMAPTSYFEQVGSAPSNNCTATGNVAGNWNCWRRGDLRWYGLNMSGVANATGPYHWNDSTTCNASSLDCPRGGVVDNFSPFDNPYIIRAWSPQGMAYDGSCVNADDGAGGCAPGTPIPVKSIYEFLAPTAQPDYTFSFWGEIEAGSTRNPAAQTLATAQGFLLKSQTIIRGNAAGSIFRLFQFTQPGNQTFGMFYHSRLQGAFRFSLAQSSATGSDVIGQPTVFAAGEGLHFLGVNAFVPLGQLYYQALTLGPVGTGGNFYLELTAIPNTATVYGEFYGLRSGDTLGYETARLATPRAADPDGDATADYLLSHGYSRWGNWYPGLGSGRNAINLNSDGFFFRSCSICATFYAFADRPVRIDKRGETQGMHQTQNYTCASGNTGAGCVAGSGPVVSGPGDATRTYPVTAGNAVNIGDGRIEGLLIHRLRMESCAAGGC